MSWAESQEQQAFFTQFVIKYDSITEQLKLTKTIVSQQLNILAKQHLFCET